jgi:hypothetical protein
VLLLELLFIALNIFWTKDPDLGLENIVSYLFFLAFNPGKDIKSISLWPISGIDIPAGIAVLSNVRRKREPGL